MDLSGQHPGTRFATLAVVVSLATTTGCTAPDEHGAALSAAVASVAMTSTERLANDLSEADAAFERGDSETLAQRLRSIDLAGATPSDASGKDALQEWRASAPKETRALRGRVLGPAYLSGTLAPGALVHTEQLLMGGKSVSIAAGTAPREGVHLRIARADGKTVCEQSPAHARECRFVPTYTQRYRIELRNSGKRDARYHIVFD
ncbi:hypothetical protein AAG612_13305 [Citromicrobium bathyomarinum]|uniref:hypothetical protein n=1 Tax=Citromicrobium bathyomarinum TaxID=72174 RepID=UPI003159B74D